MLKPVTKEKASPRKLDFQIVPDDFGDYELEGMRFKYLSYFSNGDEGHRDFASATSLTSPIFANTPRQTMDALQGVDYPGPQGALQGQSPRKCILASKRPSRVFTAHLCRKNVSDPYLP